MMFHETHKFIKSYKRKVNNEFEYNTVTMTTFHKTK